MKFYKQSEASRKPQTLPASKAEGKNVIKTYKFKKKRQTVISPKMNS